MFRRYTAFRETPTETHLIRKGQGIIVELERGEGDGAKLHKV
jgi:hypothetical protein